MSWTLRAFWLTTATVGLNIFTSPFNCAAVEKGLPEALSGISNGVVQVLNKRGLTTLAVGPFTGPKTVTSGPEITSILTRQFQAKEIRIDNTAAITLQGKMALKDKALLLFLELVDGTGNVMVEINSGPITEGKAQTRVEKERDILVLTQPAVDLPTDAPPQDRLQRIANSLNREEEPPFVEDGVVYAKKARSSIGRFGVGVIVEGKLTTPRIENGLAVVDIARGSSYQIQLINETKFDAAVDVRIDGLSTFEFSEARVTVEGPRKGLPAYTGWIVSPQSRATVPGWHRRDRGPDNIWKFLVTRYADNAHSALLREDANLGTIHVVYSAAWEVGKQPPSELNEPPKARGLPDTTTQGPPTSVNLQPVPREIGVPRASITIRYSRPTSDK